MSDPTGVSATVAASVLGTANSVIYSAAVVLASQGIGLASTGSMPATDNISAGAGALGSNPAYAFAALGLTPGASGPTLVEFVHANLDPHIQPLVGLVGQTPHG